MTDLEQLPTSLAANRMLDSISPIYSRSYVMKWLMQVMGLEMDEAWALFRELRLQMFPQTVTWAIEYWEQKFYIVPDDRLTLQERRDRLMRKYRQRPPINPRMLEKLLEDWAENQIKVNITERMGFYTFRMDIAVPLDYRLDTVGFLEYLDKVNQIHLAYAVTARRQMDGNLYLAPVVTQYRQHQLNFDDPFHTGPDRLFTGSAFWAVGTTQYREQHLNRGDTFSTSRRLLSNVLPAAVSVTQYRELRL